MVLPTARRSRLTPGKAPEILTAYRTGTRSFQNLDLRGQNFAQAQLPGIDLSGCWLQGATFRGANLRGANLSHVKTGLSLPWVWGLGLGLASILEIALLLGLALVLDCWLETQILGQYLGGLGLGALGLGLGAIALHFLASSFLGDTLEGLGGLLVGWGILGLSLSQQPLPLAGAIAWGILLLGRSFKLLWRSSPQGSLLLGGVVLGGLGVGLYQWQGHGSLEPSLGAATLAAIALVPPMALQVQLIMTRYQALTGWSAKAVALASSGLGVVGVGLGATGLIVAGELSGLFLPLTLLAGGSLLGMLLGLGLGWQALGDEERHFGLRQWSLGWLLPQGTQFQQANLSRVTFAGAVLRLVDWRGAVLDYAQWHRVRRLDACRYGRTYLRYPVIRRLFLGTLNPDDRNFDGLDLRRIHLSPWPEKNHPLDLSGASFIGTQLQEANLRQVNLTEAQLVGTHLEGACLTGACLTGACVEGWYLSPTTQTDGVVCAAVYLRQPTPNNPDPRRQTLDPEALATLLTPAAVHLQTLYPQFEHLRRLGDPLAQEYQLLQWAQGFQRETGLGVDRYRDLFQRYLAQTLGDTPGEPALPPGSVESPRQGWIWDHPQVLLPRWWHRLTLDLRQTAPLVTLQRLAWVGVALVLVNYLLQPGLELQYRSWEIIGAEDNAIQGGGRLALENLYRSGANLTNLQAPGAILSNINLQGANLSNSNFNTAQLQNANLSRAQLVKTSFENASLVNGQLGYSRFQGLGQKTLVAQMEAALQPWFPPFWRQGANLEEASLKDADLTGADLRGANLQGADLRNVIFTAALLQGANLAGTDLRSAYLNTALDGVVFTDALYSYLTVFPAAFDPEAAGMILEESLEGGNELNPRLPGSSGDSRNLAPGNLAPANPGTPPPTDGGI